MPTEPEFTQRLKMHLNGGSKFSAIVYEVFADGKPTGITRTKKTSGKPRYLIVEDTFVCGGDEFDSHAAKGVGLMAWLKARIPPGVGQE